MCYASPLVQVGCAMQKGNQLQINCLECQHAIYFSVFEIEKEKKAIACSHCEKQYEFSDETLIRQMKKFEALCRQIRDSEEILSSTNVGITIEGKNIKIPYKLLLSRLSSSLDLLIGDKPVSIHFRIEPSKDIT